MNKVYQLTSKDNWLSAEGKAATAMEDGFSYRSGWFCPAAPIFFGYQPRVLCGGIVASHYVRRQTYVGLFLRYVQRMQVLFATGFIVKPSHALPYKGVTQRC